MLGVLASQYARGQVRPVIDEVLPLSRLADAYRRLEHRQILGKLVMVPDDLLESTR
jgi:NADPH2:quinone reductase